MGYQPSLGDRVEFSMFEGSGEGEGVVVAISKIFGEAHGYYYGLVMDHSTMSRQGYAGHPLFHTSESRVLKEYFRGTPAGGFQLKDFDKKNRGHWFKVQYLKPLEIPYDPAQEPDDEDDV